MARAGRRPGPTQTKDAIVTAARAQFAERGYGATTIRSVAADAGVNPALVHHYFGTKDRLFLEVLQWPLDPIELVTDLLASGPCSRFPRRFTAAFIAAWRDPATGPALQAMARRAIGDPDSAALMRNLVENLLLPRFAQILGVPEANVAAAISHLLGLMLAATVLRVAPLATATDEELVELVSPAVARYLKPATNPRGRAGGR
ncbi:MAG TPA: TetR family transcriptional regulator [Mycobacteriales bacterium]|jgi:AcrR family transcriptional regulator|nr:TetR family transcriptional regulator [Mycobacteriales bacterium]